MSNPAFELLQGDPTTWGNPTAGNTFLGVNSSGQLVLKQSDGTIIVLGSGSGFTPSIHSQGPVTSGTVTVTPTAPIHTEDISLGGTARTVPVQIDTTDIADGSLVTVKVTFPPTANLYLQLYSDSTPVGQLFGPADPAGMVVTWHLYKKSGIWTLGDVEAPSYA